MPETTYPAAVPTAQKPIRSTFSLFGRNGSADRVREADRLEALVASSPYSFLSISGEQVYPSPGATSLLGLAPNEAPLRELYAAVVDEAGVLRLAVQELLRDQKPFDLSLPLAREERLIRFAGRVGASASGKRVATLWLEDLTGQTAAIDAERNASADLRKQLLRYRQMTDALTFPCWRRDARGKLTWCNAAYAAAVDLTPDEVVVEQREFTANLKDRAGRTLHERALRENRVCEQTKHVVIAGNRRLMEFSEMPIEGGTLGFALDQTAMDDLRSELSRHIASNSEVLETMTTAVAVFAADQKLRFHNSAFSALWGLEENWLSTQPTLSELLEHLRDNRQLPEQADFRSFKQGWLQMFTSLIEPFQDLMYRPDGTAIRLAIVPHPMGGLLFTFEDVTSRLALESSYNTLMAVQRETLDNLGEGIAVFGGDGRLDLWNPAFTRMWRLSEDMLPTRPHIAELVAGLADNLKIARDGSDLTHLMVSNAVDRLPRNGRMERGDGSVLEYHSVLLPDGGVLNSFMDVSDSVRVEQALRERYAALMAADQLKLDFLRNVSYQLRTPLTAMIGFAEMLVKQYSGPLNAKQMEYTRGTLEAGEKLVILVDAILDLSTIEAGYMRLHTAPLKIGDILEDILALAEDWAQKQEVSLVIDCPADLGTIEADERRLKQVLLNLISNALKFTPIGGSIRIAARKVPGSSPEEIALSVTDTGAGIPEADQARIFEPFENRRQRKSSSSTGVGLALVRSFIKLHGGRVELESIPGAGTSVVCYLPVVQPLRAEE